MSKVVTSDTSKRTRLGAAVVLALLAPLMLGQAPAVINLEQSASRLSELPGDELYPALRTAMEEENWHLLTAAALHLDLKRIPEELRGKAAYIVGDGAFNDGHYGLALPFLQQAAEELDPVADYALFDLALSAIKAFDFDKARTAIAVIEELFPDTPVGREIAFNKPALYACDDRWDEALKAIDDYLDSYPYDSRRDELLLQRARIFQEQRSWELAAKSYRELYINFPYKDSGKTAGDRLEWVKANTPAKVPELTLDELIERGEAFYDAFHTEEALEVWEPIWEARKSYPPGEKSLINSRVQYKIGKAWMRIRDHSKALPIMQRMTRWYRRGTWERTALSSLAIMYVREERYKDATAVFERLISEFTRLRNEKKAQYYHYRLADMYMLRRWPSKTIEYLDLMEELFPGKNKQDDIPWMRAFSEFGRKNWDIAEDMFKEIIEDPEDSFEKARARYWLARTKESAGLRQTSANLLKKILWQHRFTYYEVAARERLIERGFRFDPDNPPPLDWNVDVPEDFEKPLGWTRAEFLLELGMRERARDELFAAERALSEQENAPALFHLAKYAWEHDFFNLVEVIGTRHFKEIREIIPEEKFAYVRRLAYPLGFKELVFENATRFEVPPELVFAIMREESSFRERIASPAGAFGLMQIIEPTAEEISGDLGIPVERDDLKRPEVNVRFGAYYLSKLWRKFNGRWPLVISGYNAGPNAAAAYQKYFGKYDDHYLTESIPLSETINYVRRVKRSIRAYQSLYPLDELQAPYKESVESFYAEPATGGSPTAEAVVTAPIE